MSNLNRWCRAVLSLALLGMSACGSPGSATVREAKSDLARLPPDAPAADVATLVRNDTDFALALFAILPADTNLVFSPESISTALAMLYAGAAGSTKSEMQAALHFAQPDGELHAAFNTLDQMLESRGANASGTDGQPFQLRVSNAVWGQRDATFLPSYLDVLALNYGAGVNTVDFSKDVELARHSINAWVSDQTAGKIRELLGKGILGPDTRLVLTNAVYFNAAWAEQFDPTATSELPFSALDGSSVSVPVMHALLELPYTEADGYQAVEIPYAGDELSLLVILPAAGTFASVRAGLAADTLTAIDAGKSTARVELSLPRFEFKTAVPVDEKLRPLGMVAAFSGDADFSGIDGAHDLYVTAVVHQAFISVDEEGTEAAAATAVGVAVKGVAGAENKVFDARRPFLFAIRDNASKAVLFWGQVVDPHG